MEIIVRFFIALAVAFFVLYLDKVFAEIYGIHLAKCILAVMVFFWAFFRD